MRTVAHSADGYPAVAPMWCRTSSLRHPEGHLVRKGGIGELCNELPNAQCKAGNSGRPPVGDLPSLGAAGERSHVSFRGIAEFCTVLCRFLAREGSTPALHLSVKLRCTATCQHPLCRAASFHRVGSDSLWTWRTVQHLVGYNTEGMGCFVVVECSPGITTHT